MDRYARCMRMWRFTSKPVKNDCATTLRGLSDFLKAFSKHPPREVEIFDYIKYQFDNNYEQFCEMERAIFPEVTQMDEMRHRITALETKVHELNDAIMFAPSGGIYHSSKHDFEQHQSALSPPR